MARTLTTSGDYTIDAGSNDIKLTASDVTVTGNLAVTGTTTTITTTNTAITDNVIVLNKDESGAGVTAGTAGIEIERGSATNVSVVWNESTDKFNLKLGAGLAGLDVLNVTSSGGLTIGAVSVTAILDEDNMASNSATALATQQSIKAYADAAGSGAVAGANTQVQFNNSGAFAGNAAFTFASGTGAVTITGLLDADNIRLNGNDITSTNTNGDVTITPNGTGVITLSKAANVSIQCNFTDQGSDPSATATKNKIYSKAPSGGGTGLYFVNNTTSGEMISKSKAIAFSLVFGG
jgi:hypothetical protein